jgi:hypothetical protein
VESRVSKIREAARGEPCTLRLTAICDGGGETTVLAHIRGFGNAGTGMKPSNMSACFACDPCHRVLDGRAGKLRVHDSDKLRAILQTHDRLRQKGLIE